VSFFNALLHTLELHNHAADQAVTIKVGVCMQCACVLFQYFSLHCFCSVRACTFSILACILFAVASIYKIRRKSMVFLDFFLVVCKLYSVIYQATTIHTSRARHETGRKLCCLWNVKGMGLIWEIEGCIAGARRVKSSPVARLHDLVQWNHWVKKSSGCYLITH
jgi:hypothetical protein